MAIARALVHEPSLVVCDEPTAALDADNGHRIMQLMRDNGVSPTRAVVVVTHDSRVFSLWRPDCHRWKTAESRTWKRARAGQRPSATFIVAAVLWQTHGGRRRM